MLAQLFFDIEFFALTKENGIIAGIHANGVGASVSSTLVNSVYQTLRKVASVFTSTETRLILGVPVEITIIMPGSTHIVPQGNDTLVTIASGLGAGIYQSQLLSAPGHTVTIEGIDLGRNHASIADADIAAQVELFIVDLEQRSGDLR